MIFCAGLSAVLPREKFRAEVGPRMQDIARSFFNRHRELRAPFGLTLKRGEVDVSSGIP
jgi:hypothetical protein